jgi:hypothetical protein
MAFKQVIKYKRTGFPKKMEKPEPEVAEVNNKQKKNKEAMDERVNKAEEIMNNMKAANHVKVVKKDKGLIERTESSKIVLTEDNRQVLND